MEMPLPLSALMAMTVPGPEFRDCLWVVDRRPLDFGDLGKPFEKMDAVIWLEPSAPELRCAVAVRHRDGEKALEKSLHHAAQQPWSGGDFVFPRRIRARFRRNRDWLRDLMARGGNTLEPWRKCEALEVAFRDFHEFLARDHGNGYVSDDDSVRLDRVNEFYESAAYFVDYIGWHGTPDGLTVKICGLQRSPIFVRLVDEHYRKIPGFDLYASLQDVRGALVPGAADHPLLRFRYQDLPRLGSRPLRDAIRHGWMVVDSNTLPVLERPDGRPPSNDDFQFVSSVIRAIYIHIHMGLRSWENSTEPGTMVSVETVPQTLASG